MGRRQARRADWGSAGGDHVTRTEGPNTALGALPIAEPPGCGSSRQITGFLEPCDREPGVPQLRSRCSGSATIRVNSPDPTRPRAADWISVPDRRLMWQRCCLPAGSAEY